MLLKNLDPRTFQYPNSFQIQHSKAPATSSGGILKFNTENNLQAKMFVLTKTLEELKTKKAKETRTINEVSTSFDMCEGPQNIEI